MTAPKPISTCSPGTRSGTILMDTRSGTPPHSTVASSPQTASTRPGAVTHIADPLSVPCS